MPIDAANVPTLTVPCPTCGKWNRIRAERVGDGPKCGSCATAIALDRPLLLDDASFDRVIAEAGVRHPDVDRVRRWARGEAADRRGAPGDAARNAVVAADPPCARRRSVTGGRR